MTTTLDGHASTQTTNVSVFSLDPDVFRASCNDVRKATILVIDDDQIPVDLSGSNDAILFVRDASTTGFNYKSPWKVRNSPYVRRFQLHGPVHRFSPAPTR